jgi:hypothetical protein
MSEPTDIQEAYDSIKDSLGSLYSLYNADKTPSKVEGFVNIFDEPDWSKMQQNMDEQFKRNPADPVIMIFKKYNMTPKEIYNVLLKFDMEPSQITKDERVLRIKYLKMIQNVMSDYYGFALVGIQKMQRDMGMMKSRVSPPSIPPPSIPVPVPSIPPPSIPRPSIPSPTMVSSSGPGPGPDMISLLSVNLSNVRDLIFRIIKLLINEAEVVDNPVQVQGQKCPSCSECKECPTCPVCQNQAPCPTCPVCKDCEKCKECEKCPVCKECEKCPDCSSGVYIGVIVCLVVLLIIMIGLYMSKN